MSTSDKSFKLPTGVPDYQYEKVEDRLGRYASGHLKASTFKLWLRIDLGWSEAQVEEFLEINKK